MLAHGELGTGVGVEGDGVLDTKPGTGDSEGSRGSRMNDLGTFGSQFSSSEEDCRAAILTKLAEFLAAILEERRS